jgi:hypothetical protein
MNEIVDKKEYTYDLNHKLIPTDKLLTDKAIIEKIMHGLKSNMYIKLIKNNTKLNKFNLLT